jgi:hypothetical protein
MRSVFCFIGFLLVFFGSLEFVAFVQFGLRSFSAIWPPLHANREHRQMLVVVCGDPPFTRRTGRVGIDTRIAKFSRTAEETRYLGMGHPGRAHERFALDWNCD